MRASQENRCTPRKHVAEKGQSFCDCGALMLGMTAAKNARVVTILDPVQVNALLQMRPSDGTHRV